MTKSALRDQLSEWIDEATLFLGSEEGEFDTCIVGVTERDGQPVLVYDTDLVIAALEQQGMSDDEAWDWFGFNIEGARLGPGTPIYMRSLRAL